MTDETSRRKIFSIHQRIADPRVIFKAQDEQRNASYISHMSLRSNLPKIWKSSKQCLHPHLDTCTERFLDGFEFRGALCPCNQICRHLSSCPM